MGSTLGGVLNAPQPQGSLPRHRDGLWALGSGGSTPKCVCVGGRPTWPLLAWDIGAVCN